MSRDYVKEGMSPGFLEENATSLAEVFQHHGLLVFPQLLRQDATYLAYLSDLLSIVGRLASSEGLTIAPDAQLDVAVGELARRNRRKAGMLYELGTRPAKLMSAQALRLHPAVMAIVRAIFTGPGRTPLLAMPALSDTFHVFPPGEANFKYNLPVHQDYPYLLQSKRQLTVWISFSVAYRDVGGITLWPCSHLRGVVPSRRTVEGHLETVTTAADLASHEAFDLVADLGDVVFMDGLLWHRSNRNHTPDRTRLVQLFRYADLDDPDATQRMWASTEYGGRGDTFETVHPDLFVR